MSINCINSTLNKPDILFSHVQTISGYQWCNSGLDINVCPIPVKTDVGQVDLVSWLSNGTSEKMTVLSFGGYFL